MRFDLPQFEYIIDRICVVSAQGAQRECGDWMSAAVCSADLNLKGMSSITMFHFTDGAMAELAHVVNQDGRVDLAITIPPGITSVRPVGGRL